MTIEALEDASILAFTPAIAARGVGEDYILALMLPVKEIDIMVGWINAGVESIHEARGTTLDLLGDWVEEPRGGLTDAEYRRIIAGRRVALAGGGNLPAVYRCLQALSGDDDPLLDEYTLGLYMSANVDWAPSTAYIQRARAVMRDTVLAGVEWYAVFAPPNYFTFNDDSFDYAGLAPDFRGP